MRATIVSNHEALSGTIREVLGRDGHECQLVRGTTLEGVMHSLEESHPELLIVVLSPDAAIGFDVMREARRLMVGPILAVGPVSDPKLHLRAIREGAEHYLVEEELEAELEMVLKRLPKSAALQPRGKLIAVLASSGGSGGSTLAVNVASALARKNKNCVLVDLNLRGGDLASLLNLRPSHTLAELCVHAARVDPVMFERSLAVHESGVRLLAPIQSLDEIKQVTPEGVVQALTLARALYSHVIVDLDDFFHPEQMQVLRQAELILLVLRLDFTSLRNARRALDQLEHLGVARDKVQLVVNRYGQSYELPIAKVEEALGGKIVHYVPDDIKTVNHANNHGVPAVLESPSSKFSKSVTQLVASLNGRS